MRKPRAKKRALRVVVTPEQRYHMINDAAYFRALQHQQETGRAGDQAASWCELESEIDAVLKGPHAG